MTSDRMRLPLRNATRPVLFGTGLARFLCDRPFPLEKGRYWSLLLSSHPVSSNANKLHEYEEEAKAKEEYRETSDDHSRMSSRT